MRFLIYPVIGKPEFHMGTVFDFSRYNSLNDWYNGLMIWNELQKEVVRNADEATER